LERKFGLGARRQAGCLHLPLEPAPKHSRHRGHHEPRIAPAGSPRKSLLPIFAPQPGLPGMARLAGVRLPRALRGSPCHHHDSQSHCAKYQPDHEEHNDPRYRTAGGQYHEPDHSRGKQKDNQPEREDTAAGKPVFISPNQF